MKTTRQRGTVWSAALLAAALAPPPAAAQAPAASSASAPSTPPGTTRLAPVPKPAPHLLSPTEERDSATAPGDLRPEDRTVPQLVVPLGRRQDTEGPRLPRRGRAASASAGTIHDGAARCLALSDETERARCRDQVSHPDPARAP